VKDPSDPPRMTDSAEVAPELRCLLDKVRDDGLSSDRVKELALAVQLAIGPAGSGAGSGGTGAPAAGPAFKGASLSLGAKAIAVLVVAGAVTGGVGLWMARLGPPPARSAGAQGAGASVASAPSAQSPVEPPLASLDVVQPAPSVAAGRARSESARSRGVARAPIAAPSPSHEEPEGSSMPQEVPLLRAAREALSTDPERSLALAQEHARRFPNGVLAQEREVIAIEALAKLGRSGAAQQRASQFTEQYPASPHRARVRAATSAGPSGGKQP
jgi:hypothetical protein